MRLEWSHIRTNNDDREDYKQYAPGPSRARGVFLLFPLSEDVTPVDGALLQHLVLWLARLLGAKKHATAKEIAAYATPSPTGGEGVAILQQFHDVILCFIESNKPFIFPRHL